MGIADYFISLKQLVKSKVALPFIKNFLNNLLSPYLYPLKEINENNSIVELTSIQVKVKEINEIFFEKYKIIDLVEAKLSKITLGPIDTLIYYESKQDPCHISLHDLYACVRLKPWAWNRKAGNGNGLDIIDLDDNKLEVEKIHEIATDVIGDIIGDWIQSRDRASSAMKEMKVQGNELASELTSEEREKARKIVDNILSKLELHIIGATIDIVITESDILRVFISRIDYKDVSNSAHSIHSDEFIEKYDIKVENITATTMLAKKQNNINFREILEESLQKNKNLNEKGVLNSMLDEKLGVDTFVDGKWFESQCIFRLISLKSRINIPSTNSIGVDVGLDGLSLLLMPKQMDIFSRLVEEFSGNRSLNVNIEKSNQNLLTPSTEELIQNHFNLNSSTNSLLSSSYLDDNPELKVKTDFMIANISVFVLYDNQKFFHNNLVPAAIFDSDSVNGLHLKGRFLNFSFSERNKFNFSCPSLILEEFYEGKNSVIFSRDPRFITNEKLITFSMETLKKSSFREVVEIKLNMEEIRLKAYSDMLEKVLSILPSSFKSSKSTNETTVSKSSSKKNYSETESDIIISFKNFRLDIGKNKESQCLLLDLTNFSFNHHNFTTYNSILSRKTVINIEELIIHQLNKDLETKDIAFVKDILFELESQNQSNNFVPIIDYISEAPESDYISQQIFNKHYQTKFKNYIKFCPTNISVDIYDLDIFLSKNILTEIQEIINPYILVSSQLSNSEQQLIVQDISNLIYNEVPILCSMIHISNLNAKFIDILSSKNEDMRRFLVNANDVNILLESFSPSIPGNLKFDINLECAKDFTFTEILSSEKHEILIKSYQNMIKELRLFKKSLIATLVFEKNSTIDRMKIDGFATIQGLHIQHKASPLEDLFLNGIIGIFMNPEAPPPAITEISFGVSINDTVLSCYVPENESSLTLVSDSIILKFEQIDPPTIDNITVILNIPDSMGVYIQKDYEVPSFQKYSNLYSLNNYLLKYKNSHILEASDIILKYTSLGNKIDSTRKKANNILRIEGGSLSIKGCKDTFSKFVETVIMFKNLSISTETKMQDKSTNIIHHSEEPMSVVENFLITDQSTLKRFLPEKIEIIEDFFYIPQRNRSNRSNSRSPLGKYLPIPNFELLLLLDIHLKIYDGIFWDDIIIKANPLKNRSFIRIDISEIFLQLDTFIPEVSKVLWSRFSIKDINIIFQEYETYSILKRKSSKIGRILDGTLQIRRDIENIPRIDFEILEIKPLLILIPLSMYKFVISFVVQDDRKMENIKNEEEEEILPESGDIDTIFDSFRIAPLDIIAKVPFLSSKVINLNLFNICFNNVKSTQNLMSRFVESTLNQLINYPTIINICTSMFFLRNIRGITDGTLDLIKIPYTNIKEGRILFGVQQGISRFLVSIISETVDCTSDISYIIGEGIQKVKDAVYLEDVANDALPSKADAYSQAKIILTKSVKGAYQPIIAIPTQYRKEGSYAVASMIIKMVPVLILSPSAGVFRSLSYFLNGLQSSLKGEET